MWDYYIDILKGVPKNHWGNAFIMQSDENLQKVLFDMKIYIDNYGMNKKEACDFALNKNRLNINLDFTDLDRHKLLEWVNEG